MLEDLTKEVGTVASTLVEPLESIRVILFKNKSFLKLYQWHFFIDPMEAGASPLVCIYISYLLHLLLGVKGYQIIFVTGVQCWRL